MHFHVWLIGISSYWVRNLMAKDEFKNLGFGEDKPAEMKDDAGDQGKKDELRW